MKLIIFTEAGFNYGFGHFYRMSGICERVLHIGQDVEMHLIADEKARANLDREYVVFDNWKDPAEYKRILNRDVTLVVDSYHIDIEDLENYSRYCRDMIVIDDNMRLDYHDMMILNPNYFGPWLNYPEGKGNTVFAGKDYTLLRDEFSITEDRTVNREVSDILITMGGTDLRERTAGVISAIRSISEGVRLHVICTKAYKNLEKIRSLLSPDDRLYMNIGASEMCELMKKCDFAVATAGGTTNELIKMQCPSVFSVVADNQLLNIKWITDNDLAVVITGEETEAIRPMFSYEKRAAIVRKLQTMKSDRSGKDLICEIAFNEERP